MRTKEEGCVQYTHTHIHSTKYTYNTHQHLLPKNTHTVAVASALVQPNIRAVIYCDIDHSHMTMQYCTVPERECDGDDGYVWW